MLGLDHNFTAGVGKKAAVHSLVLAGLEAFDALPGQDLDHVHRHGLEFLIVKSSYFIANHGVIQTVIAAGFNFLWSTNTSPRPEVAFHAKVCPLRK